MGERTNEKGELRVYRVCSDEKNGNHYTAYSCEGNCAWGSRNTISDLAEYIGSISGSRGLVDILNESPQGKDIEICKIPDGQTGQVLYFSPLSEKEMEQLFNELSKMYFAKQDEKTEEM